MRGRIVRLTGTALLWRAVELVGTKSIFVVRLLILARILSPADFGLLAIALTAIGFLLGVTDFGMVPALVQRAEVDDPQYNAAWTISLFRAVAISATVVTAAPFISEIFGEPRSVQIIRVLAIWPLLEAVASIRLAGLVRDLKFRSLALVRLSEALLNSIVAIALARSFGVWALVAGVLAGSVAYLVTSYLMAPHRPRLVFAPTVARPLIRYGRWIFLTGLISVLGGAILRVSISRHLGAAELGLYFLAARLAFLPTEIASEVAGSVAFPLYARLQSDIQKATKAFRGMLAGMATLLLPACALIIAVAPSLVDNVLGSRWEGTVPLIRLLAVVSMIGLVGDAAVPVLKGLGQPDRFAVIEAVQSLLLILFAWSFTQHFGLIGAGLAWFPAILGSLFAAVVFLRRSLSRPFNGLVTCLTAIFVSSGLGAVIATAIDRAVPGFVGFVSATLLAVASFGMLLWIFDRRLNLGLATDFARAFPQVAVFLKISPPDGLSI